MKSEILQSISPATLDVVGEVAITPVEDVETIVQNAHASFPLWRDLGLKYRVGVIKTLQQLLLERSEEFARLITLEMGRPITESLVLEVAGCIELIGYYVRNAHRFLDDRHVPLHHLLFKRRKSYEYLEPLGVLGIIAPWNWPLLIPMEVVVPALLSGNAVVFKHSEFTPLLAQKFLELFLDAGVPEHVLQIVQGSEAQGKALVDSSVEKLFFTGSTDVGQKIYKQASEKLKKCVLEMGGSDPAIVCEDADMEMTSSGLMWGGYSNCGQNCNGIERIYVHENIAEPLIDLMIGKIKKLRVGDGSNPDIDMGPMANEAQLIKTEAIIDMAVKLDAKVLCGGNRLDSLIGYFIEPALILWDKSVPQPANLELFGPVVFITPVSDDAEAIRLANRSQFGLSSSVWTSDSKRGKKIARQIEAGTVMINDVIVSFGMPEAGWTGIKKSGIGWVHGEKGLDEMVNIKYINIESQNRIQKFWWYPYSGKMFETMKAGLSFLYSTKLFRIIASVPLVLKNMSVYLLFNRKQSDKL